MPSPGGGCQWTTTPEADEILNQRWADVFVIPDILCNAGGVIVSYFEWAQDLQNFLWADIEITDRLYRILEIAFTAVIKRSKERKIPSPHLCTFHWCGTDGRREACPGALSLSEKPLKDCRRGISRTPRRHSASTLVDTPIDPYWNLLPRTLYHSYRMARNNCWRVALRAASLPYVIDHKSIMSGVSGSR